MKKITKNRHAGVNPFVFLSFFFILFSSLFALAQGKGGGGSGSSEAYLSMGTMAVGSGAGQIDISPGFQFAPFSSFSWLQLGGDLTYQKISYQGSTSSIMILEGGLTANIGPVPGDAAFISLGIADRTGSAPLSDATAVNPGGIGFFFSAGKRIPLTGSFSLRPSLGVVSCGTTGMVFKPFAITYLL